MSSSRLLVSLLLLLASAALHAAPAAPPNILFAIADDWGAHAGAYGTKWVRTPHFDRVAREGILFRNAYTPNAKCAPSRAAILTGRNSWQLKEAANHICYFPPEFKGWGEALAENGWFVGHTTKGWGPGVAKNAAGQPRLMTGRAFNERKATPPASGIGPADYAANFEDFLAAAPAGKPWAFWYGAIEPHRGYEFGSGVAKGGRRLDEIDRVPAFWPDNETVRHDLLDYAFEVEHFDRHLGRMLESLARRGLLENTLVVVTSDHGMPFPRGKGSAYEFSNHVPLAIRWPAGIAGRGRVIDDHVSFVDLAPTFLAFGRVAIPSVMTGKSLLPVLRDEAGGQVDPTRTWVVAGRERHVEVARPDYSPYPQRALRTQDHVLIVNFKPDRWPLGNPYRLDGADEPTFDEVARTTFVTLPDDDAGPTKAWFVGARKSPEWSALFEKFYGRRPMFELYDLKTDPHEMNNVAESPAYAAVRKEMTERLFTILRETGDPRMLEDGKYFETPPLAGPLPKQEQKRLPGGQPVKKGKKK